MPIKELEIGIAGAGPAGLSLAIYLARRGCRVTVFDQFEEPQPVGSGLLLQPTGLTILQDLGLLPAILERGQRIDRLYGADAKSGRTVLNVRYGASGRGRFGLAVHRAAMFNILLDAAKQAGCDFETGRAVHAFDHSGDRTRFRFLDGGESARFDLVVDATGAHSALRQSLPRPVRPRQLPYGAWWASLDHVDGDTDDHALEQRYRHASVMIGILPMGTVSAGGRPQTAFFWSIKPALADATIEAGLDRWKDEVLGHWPQCHAYLDQISSFDQLTLAKYGHHTIKNPVNRQFAVIGDAAHSTSPQLGQGVNMALLDARALAQAVNVAPDIDTALEMYVHMRRRHVRTFQLLSYLFTPFYQSDSRLLPIVRDQLVATVLNVPPVPRILADMVAGTTVDPFVEIGLRETDWQHHRHLISAAR